MSSPRNHRLFRIRRNIIFLLLLPLRLLLIMASSDLSMPNFFLPFLILHSFFPLKLFNLMLLRMQNTGQIFQAFFLPPYLIYIHFFFLLLLIIHRKISNFTLLFLPVISSLSVPIHFILLFLTISIIFTIAIIIMFI